MNTTIRGARAHNLKSVDLHIPAGQLLVLRGPSGSGKSSFALDVVHAESRRRLLEVLQRPGDSGPALPPVPVDDIAGLPPTIAVTDDDGTRPDRPVAELTDLGAVLRGLYSNYGELVCPLSGEVLRSWSTSDVVADLSALPVGTRLTIGAPLPTPERPARLLAELRKSGFARVRLGRRMVRLDALDTLPAGVAVELIVDRIKWAPDRSERLTEAIELAWKAGKGSVRVEVGSGEEHRTYDAVRTGPDGTAWPQARPEHFDRGRASGTCTGCVGEGCDACDHSGWGRLARHTRFAGHTLPHLLEQPFRSIRTVLSGADGVPTPVFQRLDTLMSLGLGHVQPAQSPRTLGRGEWRRLILARALRLVVTPRMLVVDEPLSGLDPHAASQVCAVLRTCADEGATVLVIEHRPEVLAVADRVVTFGPEGGPAGGTLVSDAAPEASGPWSEPKGRAHGQPTWVAQHPRARAPLPVVEGLWTVVTGPSGSGTTSVAVHALAAHFASRGAASGAVVTGPEPRLIEPELRTSATNPRSCVITAAGIWSHVRSLFAATKEARIRGIGPDAFTFNRSSGWCPDCEGLGQHVLHFGSLPPIARTCPTCDGGRLRPDLESVRWRGHSAQGLLRLDLQQARTLFSANPKLAPTLEALVATGLGHLPLGRPTASLSSGERRRFAVSMAMARLKAAERDPRPTLVVLDQPDAGLDDAAAAVVARWLAASIAGRGTLVTVAHHPALLAAADNVVVMPRAGEAEDLLSPR